tara:strand:- start:6 stop:746 length:741 start_codon:yes stop_codon:yes gene_type:complete
MTKAALLFGLTYPGTNSHLPGCDKDAYDMAEFLKTKDYHKIRVCTSASETSAQYMIRKIFKVAIDSWRSNYKEVCIYFSGHGSNMPDYSRDEKDGKDECLIPTDYQRAGVISDDLLKRVFSYFHPNTNVIFIVDACHSGSMCDLKYKYQNGEMIQENPFSKSNARIVSISGCKDEEVSYVGFNLRGNNRTRSVLTTCLLQTLFDEKKEYLKDIQATLEEKVKSTGYKQHPQIMSSFSIFESDKLFL